MSVAATRSTRYGTAYASRAAVARATASGSPSSGPAGTWQRNVNAVSPASWVNVPASVKATSLAASTVARPVSSSPSNFPEIVTRNMDQSFLTA